MAQPRTFVDTNVLIIAFHNADEIGDAAEAVIAAPDRVFVSSDVVRLELLPKPVFNKAARAVRFYERFHEVVETTPQLVQQAEL